MIIGILALQGAVKPHIDKFSELGVKTIEVRTPADLELCDGIVLPGGESSVMIKLLKFNQLWEPLISYCQRKPTWGICAGAILLANKVTSPEQESLKAIDIEIERNAYGRQLNSFITTDLETQDPTLKNQEAVFIRAPRIKSIGKNISVLASFKNEAVMLSSKHVLLTCFHPELSPGNKIHNHFQVLVRQSV